jgi:hypothetical protein
MITQAMNHYNGPDWWFITTPKPAMELPKPSGQLCLLLHD